MEDQSGTVTLLITYAIVWWPLTFFAVLPLVYNLSLYNLQIRKALPATVFFGFILILFSIAVSIAYLLAPGYADHAEPAAVINALNAYRHSVVFPDWERGEGAYGLPYGPAFNLAVGGPLWVSKSVMASKASAFAAFLFSLLMFFVIGCRYSDLRSERFIVQYFWLVFLTVGFFAFFVRPEPFLMALSASGAALVAHSPQTRLRWVALGLLAGFATAFKAHAALYFVPLGVFALSQIASRQCLFAACLLAATGMFLALLTSFLADWQTLIMFIKYNIVLSHEGFRWLLFIVNLLTALVLAAPFGLAVWLHKSGPEHKFPVPRTATVTILTIVLFTFLGSKTGSGPTHLMPLAPPLLVLTSEVLKTLPSAQRSSSTLSFNILHAAMCVAFVAHVFVFAGLLRSSLANAKTDRAIYAEASDLARRYPGAQFGPTDEPHYKFLAYRVAPALDSEPQTFSVVFWMDLAYTGIDPLKYEPHFLKPTSEWILPKGGEPFAQPSYYTKTTLFPAIQARFQSICRIVEKSATFDVWRCDAPLAQGSSAEASKVRLPR